MTKEKQRIMAIILIGVLLCIVSLLALHVGTIMILSVAVYKVF